MSNLFVYWLFSFVLLSKTITLCCVVNICISNRILLFWHKLSHLIFCDIYDLLMTVKWLYITKILYCYIFDQILSNNAFFLVFLFLLSIYCFDVKWLVIHAPYDKLISFLIHLAWIAPVQTFTFKQQLLGIESLIESFALLKSCTNIVLQKKLEN